MDLSVLQKVNELSEQGLSPQQIKEELRAGGMSPESIDEAIVETGVPVPPKTSQEQAMLQDHHEKVIMPDPGFDPKAQDNLLAESL